MWAKRTLPHDMNAVFFLGPMCEPHGALCVFRRATDGLPRREALGRGVEYLASYSLSLVIVYRPAVFLIRLGFINISL
ncbi:hypothetical protein Nepgr_033098 [Nepenthes gracilis]|uniref:Uncharacterized protein n=1 Tax=Nepenthes gracilis TaxID=150966 RepID=A0AAD3TKL3_NEPGR|nr:hypothetical protein Nepgr_033098 [Nepenthes gracilis]